MKIFLATFFVDEIFFLSKFEKFFFLQFFFLNFFKEILFLLRNFFSSKFSLFWKKNLAKNFRQNFFLRKFFLATFVYREKFFLQNFFSRKFCFCEIIFCKLFLGVRKKIGTKLGNFVFGKNLVLAKLLFSAKKILAQIFLSIIFLWWNIFFGGGLKSVQNGPSDPC